MPKWKVTIEIDEELVRKWYEQTSADPATDSSAVRDFVGDVVSESDDATEAGLTMESFCITEVERLP